jgi:uncharacterized surface protein with fasciclin (FAS1) repeats
MTSIFEATMKGPSRLQLLLLATFFATFFPPIEAKPAKILDLADAVATNRILTKMALVLQGADLATFLSSKGPFTLFAPTDAAFAKLPPGMLDELLRPENKERLQHILLFHMVNGKKLTAKDLFTTPSLISCEGGPLALKTTKSGTQLVLKAKIIHADIRCQNGIIHEIDTVLMPPESSLPPFGSPPSSMPSHPLPATNAPVGNTPVDQPPNTNSTPAATSDLAPTAETNGTPVVPSTPPTPETANAIPVAPVAPVTAPEASPH